ncbi:tRNA uridine-5-carboxymethylaminomethyl(34) synthesis GTPase MnmE [Ketogulonicigenium vulgare]|uniref:tRNA modification GTPase MnmE n=1 Tax=Ketogulonicigenium vulgare (strain WSH-001) TaxID=759362 RepID=F9Y690_KETVW|nr:tRNA uridine-5-carboxymethylaminomethyl(34) synthesis GTPase MnmE [Ketogulonicigenium vulgare]ADO43827.1 tRNA modification GTPase [Ketogulonicigenium vulgare Y25]AEM42087.1 tRNA modification GTPase TrmE, putative [Ketogulonicigenium vulgare WSH-001]ALJ82181.1 tRNA modification GTPase TrmE [Ketogulonicigenium vulgare]ANW34802.1 tRNA uridine(34) 5-carboxymethylaminomethyl synthesis GTPase MnmE [Ketogulonicigenium vulgare]AOZ55861.1 tRNA modification GTPase [Ketogulonicigenium vulgare]
MDTIFALATARGRAGVAVIRLSGPAARTAVEQLAGPLPVHGRSLRLLREGAEVVDEALVLSFDHGRSFTGEVVVELHLHGSPAIVQAVLRILGNNADLRAAEAGEFTRRALENGRLDLAQVEGLADLIDAETEMQRRQAMRIFQGAMGAKANVWRAKLLRAAALIEATIDFADEDVPVDVRPEVEGLLVDVLIALEAEVAGVSVAERLRDGFEVAIVGRPNVGKSTLLNYLAGRDAAITSHVAGTTRDVIEVRMDIAGLPVTLLDTAGLRETADEVEQIGIARARSRAELADIRVHIVAADELPELPIQPGDIVLHPRGDETGDVNGISGLTGYGVQRLTGHIEQELSARVASVGVAMRERHRLAMVHAITLMAEVIDLLPDAVEKADLVAEDLRLAIRAIDSLVGRIDVEDILGEIFSSFCIGK